MSASSTADLVSHEARQPCMRLSELRASFLVLYSIRRMPKLRRVFLYETPSVRVTEKVVSLGWHLSAPYIIKCKANVFSPSLMPPFMSSEKPCISFCLE